MIERHLKDSPFVSFLQCANTEIQRCGHLRWCVLVAVREGRGIPCSLLLWVLMCDFVTGWKQLEEQTARATAR